MASFLDLRDGGLFALRSREANFQGVVRWRPELLRASPGATITPFLIATISRCLWRSALPASTANAAAAGSKTQSLLTSARRARRRRPILASGML
jgi:hypothetical protein